MNDRPGLAYDSDESYLWITLPASTSGDSTQVGRLLFQPDQRGSSRSEIPLPGDVYASIGKAVSVTYMPKTGTGASFDYTAAAQCCSPGSDDAGGGGGGGGGDDGEDDDTGGADDGSMAAAGALSIAGVCSLVLLGFGATE